MFERAVIDALEFARERKHLAGDIAAARLPGLADMLFDPSGDIHFELKGRVKKNGKLAIDVEIRGTLGLICRRCLERVAFDIQRRSRLTLTTESEPLSSLGLDDEEIETVPAESIAEITELVEQEVLLELPIAPAHPDGVCTIPGVGTADERSSPFSVLARLKTSDTPNSD
jgi:uncharacterized protein